MDPQTAITDQEHPSLWPIMAMDLPRLESLIKQAQPGSEDHREVTKALSLMYLQLNRMLAAACVAMGYPLTQWEWKDSEPLSEMEAAYPWVASTDWYQRQLSMILMAPQEPNHPWWDLERFREAFTSPEPSPSDALRASIESATKSGLIFDEDTYTAAKPHFQAALREFRAAGKSTKEFIQYHLDSFGNCWQKVSETIFPIRGWRTIHKDNLGQRHKGRSGNK
jgi:hypothetical protein